jgi:hypothetical protein
MLLLACGCQQTNQTMGKLGEGTQQFWDYLTGNTPAKAAKEMEDAASADERRKGINQLVTWTFARKPPYTTRYEQIAVQDKDWLVRATAIRALNRSRDTQATGIFIKALDDPNDVVRLEAAKALANVPDPKAVPALVKIVDDRQQNRDVRIAAADAMRHYKQLEVARALVITLGQRDFGVAWQSRQSLVTLTGKDLRYDEAAWLAYLASPGKPFG